jgi:single-stranded-DNA-specific exonuclease
MMAERSASGALWETVPADPRIAMGIVEETGMPIALALVLAGRGITRENIRSWLDPKIRDLMPDPSEFSGMDAMVDRLATAVRAKEKIGIFGDYDVDGASSAALLALIFRALGLEASIHIPDRFAEGYGPNLPALLELKKQGCGLIITVDCGITAHGPIAAAGEAGIDVLVIDHHIAGPELPAALSVVNPNRLEDSGAYGYLCAAGVAFMVMAGLLRRLRQDGEFTKDRPEPALMNCLDLVALATIADVVPLKGLNRAFVRAGLKVMAKRERPGLGALADMARMDGPPDTYALGFILGPRINAGGRIGDSSLGVSLLTTNSDDEAQITAQQLDTLNERRREIEKDVTAAAAAMLENQKDNVFLLAHGEGWNQGVVGISAGRIREMFGRPAAVVSVTTGADGRRIGKASARSMAPFRLGAAIMAASQKGLLIAGGGHDMAAGFTLDMDMLEPFAQFMAQRAKADFGAGGLVISHSIDAPIGAGHCSLELLDWLDQSGPFGSGFPEPRFCLDQVMIESFRTMGQDKSHLAMRLKDATGQVDAVAFRVAGTPLAAALGAATDGRPLQVLGRVSRNRYQGQVKVQFIIEDVRDHQVKRVAGSNLE